MNVLVVNAGSSSLKYQLFDTSKNVVLAKGICERIGIDGKIEHKIDDRKYTEETPIPNHTVATQLVVKYLTDEKMGCVKNMSEIEAVGHRIVHGGEYFSESMLLTDETLEKLELCRDLAPLHTGAHIMGIQGCLEAMPGVPQVLVFDTAFHQTMSKQAYMYGLPYEMYEKYHVRRYGAHGTSHRYVAAEAAKLLNKPVEETKIITCHIGNGSSISAVKGGKCIDTSMGFTPLAGILMGTRCGDIDPAIVTYIMKNEGFTPDEMSDFMNKKCGLLGLSGVSSDARDIEAAIRDGNERADLAATTLAYQIKKFIGAYTAAMDGVDAVIFTAGMGENNTELRERVCANLENFGIKLDSELNKKITVQPNSVLISTPDSKIKVYVIPTNEELVIASDTEAIVKAL